MLHRFIRRAEIFEENGEQADERAQCRLQNKLLRDKSNPFGLPEAEFRRMFRLSRLAARDLLDEILTNTPTLRNINAHAIPFSLKFFATLNLLAHGSDQHPTGVNKVYCQSQSMVSRGLHLVLDEILKLTGKYIRFPTTPADISSSKANFLLKYRMPGILFAIDGTHIAIVKPPAAENGYLYYNRKHYYSLNVLSACNADQLFVYANANYPGSVHDSAIYQMSDLDARMPHENAYMLGDSGFPTDRFMLTPVANARAQSKQEKYNIAHKHTRNIVERTFGCLKMRFRCLSTQRVLYYSPKTAAQIVYACMVLHNICLSRNIIMIPEDDYVQYEEDNEEDGANNYVEPDDNRHGNRVRDMYINRNF